MVSHGTGMIIRFFNLGDANSYEIINISDSLSYTVSHDDQLHYISAQVSFVDGKGNSESAVFTSSNIVPTSELTQTTLMALEDYPSDPELLSLFAVDGSQYKWGGNVGTAPTLTYSFASMNSFLDGETYTFGNDYYDAIDVVFDSSANTILQKFSENTDYHFQTFFRRGKGDTYFNIG